MPINLQGSGNIAEGWGKAPDLDAPALGGIVASILANKLARDKMTQENIADTIRNVREERQSAQYLDAMKAAGLISQDYDAGGLGGAKLGTGLAKMIQDKREFDALEKHRRVMETRVGGRGGRGSRGDDGVTPVQAYPETIWDEQGREWRKGPGGRLIPMKPTGGTKAGGQTDNVAKDVKEALGLQDQFDILEGDRKKQEAEDITAGRANVPFKQSDLYNMAANRLKELRAKPGMPSTAPQGVPQRPPAETGDALPTSKPVATAEGYGNPVSDADVEALAWAKAHPDDPRSAAILKKLGL